MSELTIGSASDFHTNVYKAITTATPAALHIEALVPGYKRLVDDLASVVNRKRSYISTKLLDSLDKTRDNGVGYVFNVLDANTTCLIPEKVKAANRLLPQVSSYRKIRYHEYSKQSAELRGMLGVLEAEENAADVATLGIGPDIEALREVAEEFEETFKAKTLEAAEHADQSDFDSKELTREAQTAYEGIAQVVNAYAIVQPTDELLSFIHEVNGLVATYAQIADGSTSGGTAPEPAPGGETGGEETGDDGDEEVDDGGSPGVV